MQGKGSLRARSGCPVSVSLEIFGDRWSLLIIRDMMVRGYGTFKEFQNSGEGIATNILSDRLDRLERAGIISAEADQEDARRVNYRLTEKGIDLAPVMLELLIWGARHQKTGAPCEVVEHLSRNRAQVLAETRRRWEQRDATPILLSFETKHDKHRSARQ
ncbi:MAG TPA: helix-turn-helix domain-containing protein [Terriglobales bacterium]|jgi:DNA-binding HxlR family transcriptional regulator|nr:helix-turn-helix domain-containing protein [Terriglobales bacterium]